mgnify:CR=1 FL=1
MRLFVFGVTHEQMNMDEREIFHFRDSDKLSFSTRLLDLVDQILILSTCNRSEVYVIADDSFDENQLKHAFFSYFHQESDHYHLLSDEQALLYLLEVACGLQSMVVGEDQILHQLKDAYKWSCDQHFNGKELNYVIQNVIKFAKEMRTQYAISEHPLSISYIGYQYVKEYLNDHSKIMVCGIGEMSKLMIEYLSNHEIYIVNRTYEKVIPYLSERIHYVPFEDRYEYLEKVDVVVSATASPHMIFTKNKIDETHPLLFLDLAMPRDIDKHIEEIEGMRVIDMDSLKKISKEHYQKRLEICELIREECLKQASEMYVSLHMMKSDDLIARMQQRYLDISDETYELLNHKLDLSSKEQYILKKVLKTSFLRLMKEPVLLLKTKDLDKQQQYIELVSQLLDIKEK